MNDNKIREPKQKRSKEKKNKIIEVGFKLFCEKGYFNTNTAEIAKEAGVSTGIVYNYFKDKKDIFMGALELYANSITAPVFDNLKKVDNFDNMDDILSLAIDSFIQSHYICQSAHEEMMAMSHLDQDISDYFRAFEENTTRNLVILIEEKGIHTPNIHEKMHIIHNMVENLCHEVVYHHHDCLNYDIMKKEVIKIIHNLLLGE